MKIKTRLGAIAAASVAAVMLLASPAGAATAPVTVAGCVATLDGKLLEVGANFTADAGVNAGSVSVAFQVPGDPGPIESWSGLGPGTFSKSTSHGNSSVVVGGTVDVYTTYTFGTDPEVSNLLIGSCTISAKPTTPPVSNPPAKTPFGLEPASADPTIGVGLTALVIGLVSAPFVIRRLRRDAIRR